MSALDDLLDTTLDDLEDLPSFKPFTPGAHRVLASFGIKEISGKDAVELTLTMIESIEIDPNAEVPKEGDSSGILFTLDNEFGRGKLKAVTAPFREAMGFSTIRDVVEGVKDVECVVITSIRKDKKDPDREYLNLKEIQIV